MRLPMAELWPCQQRSLHVRLQSVPSRMKNATTQTAGSEGAYGGEGGEVARLDAHRGAAAAEDRVADL